MNQKIRAPRWIGYLLGNIVLALGLTLNTQTQLGVSPIMSMAYSASEIFGKNFGDSVFAMYVAFVVIQIFIHIYLKRFQTIPLDAAQLLLSLIFTRILNVFKMIIPDFEADLGGTIWGSLPLRLLFLLLAIVLTGIGAALTLNARLVPNPGDGIVQAIADLARKEIGLTKNFVDISCVIITCSICLIFGGKIIGIGIGTILAMIGVGRIISTFNAWLEGGARKYK